MDFIAGVPQATVFLTAALAAASLILGELTGDTSWVDRLWSVVPTLHAWVMYFTSGPTNEADNARALAMCWLMSAWSVRLTFNFWRKGGYTSAGEDYRWPILRERYVKSRLAWFIFNLTFISTYQNILLMMIALPVQDVLSAPSATRPLNWMDAFATLSLLAALVGETVADNEQWVFQTEKWRRRKAGEKLEGDYARGFLTGGLFRYSRHPNFFCEQALWVAVYMFAVAKTGVLCRWSALGCLQLIMLFQGSTSLTEMLTKEKYPEYAEYQKRVSRLIPLPPM